MDTILIEKNKFVILGGNSFVGRHLYEFLLGKENVIQVSRNQINFLDSKTFDNLNFSNTVIIDCINVNNGINTEIESCNCIGFKKFIDHLVKNKYNVKYVYLSTVSVLSEEIVRLNPYVSSKKIAEDYLISSGLDYQIIRLAYPIGKNENKDRLISRLINNLKSNNKIIITDILINLNDIDDVVKSIYERLYKEKISFISSNQYYSLKDIVLRMKSKLASKSEIEIKSGNNEYLPKSANPFIPTHSIYETLDSML